MIDQYIWKIRIDCLCQLHYNRLYMISGSPPPNLSQQMHNNISVPRLPQNPRFHCPTCEYYFKSERDLSLHIDRVHVIDRRKDCLQCGATFQYPQQLKNHLIDRHGRRSTVVGGNYSCNICSRGFDRMWKLRTHLNENHARDEIFPIYCHDCRKSFQSKPDLWTHKRLVHGGYPGGSLDLASTQGEQIRSHGIRYEYNVPVGNPFSPLQGNW